MTIIFSILLIVTVVISTSLLIILLRFQHKPQRLRKMLSKLKNAAAEAGVSITKQDVIGSRVIGVDMENARLLFLSTVRNRYDGYFIDLHDIKSYEVDKEYGLIFNNHSRKNVAEMDVIKISLHLFYKNGAKRLVLPFYDKLDDQPTDIGLRLHQANEWRDLLSSITLRNRKPLDTKLNGKTIPAFRTYIDAA